MSVVETVLVKENLRLTVHYEDGPECPRGDWHMLTGFVKLSGHGDGRLMDVPAVHDSPISIVEALERFESFEVEVQNPGEGFTRTRFPILGMEEELVVRWARIFHGMHVEYDSEHGGFWFVAGADAATARTPVNSFSRALFYDNWPELEQGSAEALEKQAEVIKQEREVYRQWAEGEVYGVTAERLVTSVKQRATRTEGGFEMDLTAEPEVVDEWENIEDGSLWGNYADEDESYNLDLLALRTASENFDLTDDEQAAVDQAIAEHHVTKRRAAAAQEVTA